jgi:pentatricopeptide repeat protein
MIKGYSRIKVPENGVSMYLEMLRRNVKHDHHVLHVSILIKGIYA